MATLPASGNVGREVGPAEGGVWGLARVVRLEQPSLKVLSADVSTGALVAASAAELAAAAATTASEPELSWDGSARRHVLRLRRGGLGHRAGA